MLWRPYATNEGVLANFLWCGAIW